MLKGFKRGILLFLTGVIFLSPVFVVMGPSITKAASSNPQDQLERWLYYKGMRACLEDPYFEKNSGNDDETISVADINEGHLYIRNTDAGVGGAGLYGDQKEGFGYLARDLDDLDGDDGTVDCTDGSIWVRGAHIFGFPNVINLICAMNDALEELGDGGRIDPQRDGGECINAQEVYFDGGSSIFQQALTKALENPRASKYGGDGDRPFYNFDDNSGRDYTSKALLYLLGKNSLETFCGGPLSSAKANDSYDGDKYGVSVYIVESNGTIKNSGKGGEGLSFTYTITNENRDGESDDVNDIYYAQGGNTNEADDRNCGDMARWTREGAAAYAAWAKKNTVEAEENESGTIDTSDNPSSSGESATSCAIDGIGWIICPVMNFLAEMNEKAFNFLQSLLGIRPSLIQDKGTVEAWSRFRDFANVAFVIAFMVIIYSQITSVGVSNYGIKKLLPKIAIAAIMVNLSLFFCQILVDVSNIAGASLYAFLKDMVPAVSGTTGGSTWTSIMTGVLAAGVGVLLVVLVVTAPTVLLALGLILLILVARQAFVLILVIISPLAFVAYLLPNTEDLFKKWWKALSATLLVYPIIAVVFGASTLASNILMGIASSKGNVSGDDDSQMLAIVALAVMAVPLFAVPSLLKGAMAGAGKVGATLAGLQDRANRRASGDAKQRIGSELKDVGNRFSNRALTSSSRRGAAARFVSGVGRRAKREDRYKQNQSLREANQDNFLNGPLDADGNPARYGDDHKKAGQLVSKSAQRRANVAEAQSTASASGSLIQNTGKQASLRNNTRLHENVAESNTALHHEEGVIKNVGETRYYQNPNNADHIAEGIAAQENRQAAETNALNQAKTGLTPASVAARQAIADNKAAKGQEKLVDQGLELNFQTSDIGRSQVQGLKAVEGELEIEHGEQKNIFEGSVVGQAQAQQKKVIQGTAKIIEGEAELTYETSDIGKTIEEVNLGTQAKIQNAKIATDLNYQSSDAGQAINIAGAVVQAQLGAVKAANDATVQELKAGPEAMNIDASDPAYQTAIDISEADIQQRVQTQRAANAKKSADVEYAQKIGDDAASPTQLAIDAAGITGAAGVSQAQAVARQTMVRAFNEGVAAEKTLLSRTDNDDLLARMDQPDFLDQPDEVMAAIAGTVADRQHQASHIKLWSKMGKLQRQAEAELASASTPEAKRIAEDKIGKVKDMQQQVMGDKKRTPFGVGDSDQGKAGIGEYEGDIYESTRNRISTHMSAQKLATMDPDDIQLIFEMAREGKLSDDQIKKVTDAYNEWEKDPMLKSSLQDKHRVFLDPIRQHGTTGAPAYPPDSGRFSAKYDDVKAMSTP